MKNKLEQKLDAEFERMGVKPFIYHFFSFSQFNAITIASFRSSWEEIASCIQEANEAGWRISSYPRASSLIRNLATDYYIYGVAICDRRDAFNRPLGRIIAKGRLLKHLKEMKKRKW